MPRQQPTPERDPEAVSRFIERFASVMTDTGFARMPARVFAAILATDSGRLTASEIAEQLQISPAAVSGALRYLTQFEVVAKEYEPGSRRAVYVAHDDLWYEASMRKDQLYSRWQERLDEGIGTLGAGTPAGERLAETRAFFAFIQAETPGVLERWRRRRDELRREARRES